MNSLEHSKTRDAEKIKIKKQISALIKSIADRFDVKSFRTDEQAVKFFAYGYTEGLFDMGEFTSIKNKLFDIVYGIGVRVDDFTIMCTGYAILNLINYHESMC
jgi:hypothetical protein